MSQQVGTRIPREIMNFLVDNHIIANMNDLCQITVEEVQSLRTEYDQKLRLTPNQENVWTSWFQVDLAF